MRAKLTLMELNNAKVFEQILFCHLEEKRANNKGKLIFHVKLKNIFGQEYYLNLYSRNMIRDMRIPTIDYLLRRVKYKQQIAFVSVARREK